MKAKTIIEKQLTEFSTSLPLVSAQMHAWAEKNLFLKWAVLSRGKFYCLECTHSWKPVTSNASCSKFTKCTACSGKLKMQQYNQVNFKEIEYFAVLDTCGGFQVVRIVCSHKYMKKGFTPTYFHKEVIQHWINPKGEVRTLSLSTNVFSNVYDAWKYHSPLEIRPKNFCGTPKYRINPYKVYPTIKVLPIIKRNGFKTSVYGIAPQVLFTALLKDSIAETLLKASQTALLSYYLTSSQQQIRKNWQAVKTCLKHNYQIEDFKIWEDYISLLRWFKKDLYSEILVCPENLNEAHDKLVLRKRTIQIKNYLLKMRSEILKAQEVYFEEKKQFFGLYFSMGNINIQVLENVKDFMEEGDTLQHCVFTNEYYTKKDSLILSAKADNTLVETIEVSLSSMEIIQCRGMKNKKSKHHKQILELMSKNLYQIAQRIKKKKTKPVIV